METRHPLDAASLPTTVPTMPAAIRTPDQRVRVFVSSALDELAPERAAARHRQGFMLSGKEYDHDHSGEHP